MPRVQVIVDMDGMNMKKLNNPKGKKFQQKLTIPDAIKHESCYLFLVIPFAIKIIRRYKSAAEFGLEHAVGINRKTCCEHQQVLVTLLAFVFRLQ